MTPERAKELLPCHVKCGGNAHYMTCPAAYREAVTAALAEAEIRGRLSVDQF